MVYTPVLGTGRFILWRFESSPGHFMEKNFTVKEEAGKRLDKFLVEEFFSYSRGEINRFIKEGRVLVNGKPAKPSRVLAEGEVIQTKGFAAQKSSRIAPDEKVVVEIVFENEDFVVLNKSAGISVHPKEVEQKGTVANWLVAKYGDAIYQVNDGSALSYLRPGIVHRLDKDTSGVMVVALNRETLEKFKELFAARKVQKEYLAITKGLFAKKEGIIDKLLARKAGERKQVVAKNNTKTKVRGAITEYKVLKQEGEWAVVLAKPRTGRMHQIRVHLADLGHPIIGDKLYGNLQGATVPAQRQLLHAWRISFEFKGQKYAFSAPIPADMVGLVGNID